MNTTPPTPAAENAALSDRVKDYLCSGGLFNPELANHDAVRDLIIDLRDELAAAKEKLEKAEKECERAETALGDLYDYITNGLLSKPYEFEAVKSAIDDALTKMCQEENAESLAREAQLRACLEAFVKADEAAEKAINTMEPGSYDPPEEYKRLHEMAKAALSSGPPTPDKTL